MHPLTHLDIGQIGENAALRHYEKRGFRSIQQNYQKPFGEIDLIVEKDKKLVFVEVKSVSCKTYSDVSRDTHNPAENIHFKKRKRLRKTIVSFLSENDGGFSEWRFDVALVLVNTKVRHSRVEIIEDVVL